MTKQIELTKDDYTIGDGERPGLVSRLFGWVDDLWGANRAKRAEQKAYKAQLKNIENQVYTKKKMEADVKKAIEKGENRAKPLTQKIEEMSEKLQEAGEKLGGTSDGKTGEGIKGDLFGNPMQNSGIDINTMFSNDKNNKRGGGLF